MFLYVLVADIRLKKKKKKKSTTLTLNFQKNYNSLLETRGGRSSQIQCGNTDLRDHYMYQACTAYVLPHNLHYKIHLTLFQEGCKVAPRRIFGWNNFALKIVGSFDFFF